MVKENEKVTKIVLATGQVYINPEMLRRTKVNSDSYIVIRVSSEIIYINNRHIVEFHARTEG